MADNTSLGPEAVAHMAALSRLVVNREEEALFARQFADILGYMDVLSKVDTSHTEPLFSPVLHEGITREDTAHNRRSHEQVLGNAPDADGQYFIVPRIV
ncbi:MAG: Asp-tRNA(Asn)/Glu-tRNA(Gln) amidotransferase subunit GatC [Desulfovibrio sp.]|nr:Asp-tRNA(Asn)/Glu-tRNA(Gln) amidotransferase subunit GatC [Desulfovibrio sp.]